MPDFSLTLTPITSKWSKSISAHLIYFESEQIYRMYVWLMDNLITGVIQQHFDLSNIRLFWPIYKWTSANLGQRYLNGYFYMQHWYEWCYPWWGQGLVITVYQKTQNSQKLSKTNNSKSFPVGTYIYWIVSGSRGEYFTKYW